MQDFFPTPVIDTERLHLRGVVPSDVEFIQSMRSNPVVNKHLARKTHMTLKEAEDWIEMIIKKTKNNQVLYWVIEGERPIGGICLWNFEEDGNEAELGYMLLPEFHRQGIMIEAMKKIVDFGFSTLKLDRIIAYTDKKNDPSRRLLEKFGFEYQEFMIDVGFPDNVTYTIVPTEK